MKITTGTKLGRYEIRSLIGIGGMGEVYRASDPKIGRDVAIKVLPADFSADKDRVARFEQEAQAAGALNHPNIIAVYDVDSQDGVLYVVSELLEGEELRQRLDEGAIPLRKVTDFAQQIVNGLSTAHEKGIVHRDLKPENIFITKDDRVKILDFGLAKLLPSRNADFGLRNSQELEGATLMQGTADAADPPIQNPKSKIQNLTSPGVVMGTVGYMSPEQVRGHAVDHRSDIFSFGLILYEMITGRRAFQHETMAETMSAILKEEPPEITESNPNISPALERIVRRCLEKKAERRFQSTSDLGFALETLSATSSSGVSRIGSDPMLEAAAGPQVNAVSTASEPRRFGIAFLLGAALLTACAAAALTWWIVPKRSSATGSALATTITRVTADSGLTTGPAVAPNGNLLAYSSDRGGGSMNIWVQPLPDGQPVQVTHGEVDATEPQFSPDGSRIVYRSERNGGGIYVVPALGGAERFVVAKGRKPRYSPDGKLIAYVSGGRATIGEMWAVNDGGGTPRRLLEDVKSPSAPVWSPDGKWIVTGGSRGTGEAAIADWWIVNVESGDVTAMGASDAFKRLGPSFGGDPEGWIAGRIVFSADSGDVASLWSVDVSPDQKTVTGIPRRLTAGVGKDITPALTKDSEGLAVYYANRDIRSNLYRLPLSGSTGEPEMEQVTNAAAADIWPSLSADGGTLVFASNRTSGWSTWLRELASGRETPLTAGGGGRSPSVSPDGQRVAYLSFTQDSRKFVLQSTGGGAAEPLPEELGYVWSWPSDRVLLGSRSNDGKFELVAVDPTTRDVRSLLSDLKSRFYGHGQLSPDGKWASVMEWSSADQSRIILFPFRDTPVPPAEWVALTDEQTVEEEHVWSPKGDAIYFVSERDGSRCIWMRKIDQATKRPSGPIIPVLHLHGARRSMITTAESPQRIALGGNSLYFSVQESRGNIWKATNKDQ